MPDVIVLGASGMLGTAVARQLTGDGHHLLGRFTRSAGFDVNGSDWPNMLEATGVKAGDYVINCIGITKSHINDQSIVSRKEALRVNVEFPLELAQFAERTKLKVLQVATDCVFSGLEGDYDENSSHDAFDVYGKTKSLGEAVSEAVMHLRCSLVGPEAGRSTLLYEWVNTQPKNATIIGFLDHFWNGLTSTVFARVVSGIVEFELFEPRVQHLVPFGSVSKYDLVKLLAAALGRDDISIQAEASGTYIDRRLSTLHSEFNERLFQAAGFPSRPTVAQMIEELSGRQLH